MKIYYSKLRINYTGVLDSSSVYTALSTATHRLLVDRYLRMCMEIYVTSYYMKQEREIFMRWKNAAYKTDSGIRAMKIQIIVQKKVGIMLTFVIIYGFILGFNIPEFIIP